MRQIISILTGLILAYGCVRAGKPGGTETIQVSLGIQALSPTKSYLTDPDIETRVSDVTLGIFEADGTPAYLGYFTESFGTIGVTLRSDRMYDVFALANLGDRSEALAAAVSDGSISEMTCTVDYESMASAGIPMAGVLSGQLFFEGQNTTVFLQRLLAKIQVSLSCNWPDAVITSATVKHVNPTVAPFGSAPAGSNNEPTLQDIHGTVAGTGSTLSAVFYVPENTQGTVESISTSLQKTYSNEDLESLRDYATYLEVNVSTSGMYDGNILYRSYLGANQTTDFNILRNQVYDWTITYYPGNWETTDWKRVADVSTWRMRSASLAAYSIPVGGSTTASALKEKYVNGVASGETAPATASWVSNHPAVASVDASGFVYGLADGSATFTATDSSCESGYQSVTTDPALTVRDTYQLEISGSPSAVRTAPIVLTATLKKNGSPVPASFSYSWISGEGYADISPSGNVFTISAVSNRSCRWHDMDCYTIRFQVETDAHTGTLTQDVDIVFEPTVWSVTIGLRYESGSSFTFSSCSYYAEASEILPAEAQSIPLTATDNWGNNWAFDGPAHSLKTESIVNPGGFNPGGNHSVAQSLHIVSITPSSLYAPSWDADFTFLAGETQPN